MTREQAQKLYSDISSLVYVFGGDLRRKCLQRGIPEELVEEFIEADRRFNRFLKAHDFSGEKNEPGKAPRSGEAADASEEQR